MNDTSSPSSSPALLAGRWQTEEDERWWSVERGEFRATVNAVGPNWKWKHYRRSGSSWELQGDGYCKTLSLAQAACERAAGEYLEGLWAEQDCWPQREKPGDGTAEHNL